MVFISLWSWVIIHECAHILMAKMLLNVTSWKISLIPKHLKGKGINGEWLMGLASYRYMGTITPLKQAAISLAPLIPDLIVIFVLPFLIGKGINFWTVFLFVVYVAGLHDLLQFMCGREHSDIEHAVEELNVSHNALRFPVIVAIIISLVALLWR